MVVERGFQGGENRNSPLWRIFVYFLYVKKVNARPGTRGKPAPAETPRGGAPAGKLRFHAHYKEPPQKKKPRLPTLLKNKQLPHLSIKAFPAPADRLRLSVITKRFAKNIPFFREQKTSVR